MPVNLVSIVDADPDDIPGPGRSVLDRVFLSLIGLVACNSNLNSEYNSGIHGEWELFGIVAKSRFSIVDVFFSGGEESLMRSKILLIIFYIKNNITLLTHHFFLTIHF